MPERGAIEPCLPKACAKCPWRLTNFNSKPDPNKFYVRSNLRRLWKGLRSGKAPGMTCHPTDPAMNDYEGMAVPEGATTHECTGSLVLLQREFMRYQAVMHANPGKSAYHVHRLYKQQHPNGLTFDGLQYVFSRAIGTAVIDGAIPMGKPNLNDREIGMPDLTPWDPDTEGRGA